jgi:membrane protease YdiL (CAAX protease family)
MELVMDKGRVLEGTQAGGLSSPAVMVTTYIAAIAGAEAAVVFLGTVPGMIGHGVVLILLFSHYILLNPASSRDDSGSTGAVHLGQALPVLSLFPLLRILSLALPITFIPEIYWNALVGVPLLIAIVLTARLLGWSPSDAGLSLRSWPWQLLIALTGIPLSVAAYFAMGSTPLTPTLTSRDALIGAVILVIFGGFIEEILFRGLLQRVTTEIFGTWGIVWASVLFAGMYLGTHSAPTVALMGLIGLFFGWCVDRTGSTWGVILAHGIMLVGIFYALPYLGIAS